MAMNGKVSPVSVPVKATSDLDIKVEVTLRCTKCQLIMPCNCFSNARRVSEVRLLNYELSEKQELAAETVRGMQTRKRKSTSTDVDAVNLSKTEPTRQNSTEKRMTLEDFVIETEKMADVGFSNNNSMSAWLTKGSNSAKNMFKVSTDNKLALKLYGNKAAVVMEQRRQAQKGDGVIHPFSTFRWYWDIIMVILITTHVLLLPVSIAFVDQELSPGWLALNCVSDAVFIMDIFLNFRTGVIDFSRQEEVILDKKVIRRKYLRGWFIIDVLSSLPFDYVYIIASSSSSGDPDSEILQASRILRILKLTKLLSLLKLLRVSRIVRYIKELEELLNIQSGQMRILKLIGCMLLLSHWNGCVQFLIPRLMGFPDDSWVTLNGLKNKPSFQQYSWSLFNAMSHMLCIGYGRYPPNNTTELWVMLCSMTIGATFYAVFIGIMSTLIMSIDSSGRLYKEKLNQVGEYMRYRKLPLQVRRRVQDYYEHRYHHKLFDEDAILAELSSPLREEIQLHNARSLLTSVPFFSDASEEFISLCVALLKFEVFLPGDVVFKRGSKGDRMYFIVRGIVDILTTDGFVATSLTDGSHFGEISLMRVDGRRTATCRAATMLDLYSLNTSAFKTVIDAFPGMQSVFSEIAVERLQRLDKYSDDARQNEVKRDYKTEKITSKEMENTEINKKRLGAMRIPTLTKGFIHSMTPTLGVATLNKSETTTGSELPSVDEGETSFECSDWTSVVPEGHHETTTGIPTEMDGKEYRE